MESLGPHSPIYDDQCEWVPYAALAEEEKVLITLVSRYEDFWGGSVA